MTAQRYNYIVPAKLQNEYCTHKDQIENDTKIAIAALQSLEKENPLTNGVVYHSYIVGRQENFGFPTRVLSDDLAAMLADAAVPIELTTKDLHFPWPSFRIMVPKSLCIAKGLPYPGYLDIGLTNFKTHPESPVENDSDFKESLVIAFTSKDSEEGGIIGGIFAYNDESLGDLINQEFTDGQTVQDSKHKSIIVKLALNILLLMSAYPEELLINNLISRSRVKNGKKVPAQYEARFLWDDQFKKIYAKESNGSDGWDINHPRPHWVRGHWRKQRCGYRNQFYQNRFIMSFFKPCQA